MINNILKVIVMTHLDSKKDTLRFGKQNIIIINACASINTKTCLINLKVSFLSDIKNPPMIAPAAQDPCITDN